MDNIKLKNNYYNHKKFDFKRRREYCEEELAVEEQFHITSCKMSNFIKNTPSSLEVNNSISVQYNDHKSLVAESKTNKSKRLKFSKNENDENRIIKKFLTPTQHHSNNMYIDYTISNFENNFDYKNLKNIDENKDLNKEESLNTARLNQTDARNLINLPKNVLVEVCKYRPRMARTFPGKKRNKKEQERRDKNTMACRKTRRLKKLEDLAVEQNCIYLKDQHLKIFKENIRGQYYIEELLKLLEIKMLKKENIKNSK
ncbi:uncharacterized protein LOC129608898 [Condylostylus longicornis]|uniref:uncharacterized protein LOC129608898 n=1 Tax=Condylostylus longicornis TaxID=2530218 RepID=UPI00244DF1D4|nr:uncharacterized protein LOC129608898 [Condylostylus longicornis]